MPVPQPGAVPLVLPQITLPRRCAGTLGNFNFSRAVNAFKYCKLLSG